MNTFTAKILTCDEPTAATGRIYQRSVIEQAIEKYQDRIDNSIAVGELKPEGNSPHIRFDKVSHKITGLRLNGSQLWADVEILRTPAGIMANELLDNGVELRAFACGVGSVDDDNVVNDDYELVAIHLSDEIGELSDWLPELPKDENVN